MMALFGFLLAVFALGAEALPEPHQINSWQNMWVTWTKSTGWTNFCLILASATDPFQTCFIGMLFLNDSDFSAYSTGSCNVLDTPGDCSFLNFLGVSIPQYPGTHRS